MQRTSPDPMTAARTAAATELLGSVKLLIEPDVGFFEVAKAIDGIFAALGELGLHPVSSTDQSGELARRSFAFHEEKKEE
jgi:hypothetical protein